MSDCSAKTKVASSVLPWVKLPQPRCSAPTLLHRNPLESVLHVHAELGDFAKDYYAVEFGPRAGIVAVSEGKVLLTAQYRFLINGIAWEIPGGRVDEGEMPSSDQKPRSTQSRILPILKRSGIEPYEAIGLPGAGSISNTNGSGGMSDVVMGIR